jgi:hypothetical protein
LTVHVYETQGDRARTLTVTCLRRRITIFVCEDVGILRGKVDIQRALSGCLHHSQESLETQAFTVGQPVLDLKLVEEFISYIGRVERQSLQDIYPGNDLESSRPLFLRKLPDITIIFLL